MVKAARDGDHGAATVFVSAPDLRALRQGRKPGHRNMTDQTKLAVGDLALEEIDWLDGQFSEYLDCTRAEFSVGDEQEYRDAQARADVIFDKFRQAAERIASLEAALAPELSDVEAEAALVSEGIHTWGPDAERFERMFAVVMRHRQALDPRLTGKD
jgi:hypothetical protein